MSVTEKKKLTPDEVAKEWGIPRSRVISWINNGELPAADASVKRKAGGKPRYLIDRKDLEDFWNSRLKSPVQKPARRAKRKKDYIEFHK